MCLGHLQAVGEGEAFAARACGGRRVAGAFVQVRQRGVPRDQVVRERARARADLQRLPDHRDGACILALPRMRQRAYVQRGCRQIRFLQRVGPPLQVDGVLAQVAMQAGHQLQAHDTQLGIEPLFVGGRQHLVQLRARRVGQRARARQVAAQFLDARQLRQREADAGRARAANRMLDVERFTQ